MVLFSTRTGKSWSLGHLRHEIARVLSEIGFPGYGAHGLRVKAAILLYEAGVDWEDIGAVLGHRAMRMVRHYTRQGERAKRAIARMEQERNVTNLRDKRGKPGQDG
jgi:integrase